MGKDARDIIVFDLDDTLTESKSNISEEMSRLLHGLLCAMEDDAGDFKFNIGIISGCAFEQFEKQLIKPMFEWVEKNDAWNREVWAETVLSHLYLMPASGSQLYFYYNGWKCAYKESLVLRQKVEIYHCFEKACDRTKIYPSFNPYGEIAEDRDSQITFSMLGQQAPLEIKKSWDPDQQKRLEITRHMKQLLPDYEITVGGATSIDVTLKGRDKAYGMHKFINYSDMPFKCAYRKENVTFIADALFQGGNDHSVISMGIKCIETKNPKETKNIIKKILGESQNATV